MDSPGTETMSIGPFVFVSWVCFPLCVDHFLSHGGWLPTAVCVSVCVEGVVPPQEGRATDRERCSWRKRAHLS